MRIPPTLTSPRILLRADGRPIVVFDAGDLTVATPRKLKPEGDAFQALGYRQTIEPAARGGKANRKGIRFRNGGMRAIVRSFRGKPFLRDHDWHNLDARGGTITDAWLEEQDGEQLVFFGITAVTEWAKAGLANGMIDRFSWGVDPTGEITCTVHECPVFTDCYCFPGELVMANGAEVLAEWEIADGDGMELSGVNVPAVDDTFVLGTDSGATAVQMTADRRMQTIRDLSALCGRNHPDLAALAGGGPKGGFTRAAPASTMSTPPPETQRMDPREQMAKNLGLPADATWDQIMARQTQLSAEASTLREQFAENAGELAATKLESHVTSEIAKLRASHQVTDKAIERLRIKAFGTKEAPIAPAQGRVAFDQALETMKDTAPVNAPSAGTRAALQSDAPAVRNEPSIAATLAAEPDAYEQHSANPELPKLMRACRLSVANVREFGPKAIPVLHNLGDLVAATGNR